MNGDWFAGRLRELREASGLTQQQLAEKAGMAWRTITHLEGGDRKPSWETVVALAKAIGCSTDAFNQEPKTGPPYPHGRPSKAEGAAAPGPPNAGSGDAGARSSVLDTSTPKRGRGRPKKER